MRIVNRVRFNQQAVRRNLRRKMLKAGKNRKQIKAQLNPLVQKYRKKAQMKAAKNNQSVLKAQKQAQQASKLQTAGRVALAGRIAHAGYTRLVKAPLSNLASIGRWR